MDLGITKDSETAGLATRLAWVTAIRLLLLTLLLGTTTVLYLRGALAQYPFSSKVVFFTIAAAYAVGGAYAALLRSRTQHLVQLAFVQVVLDQITWTALVYVSGGASSGATSFYALTTVLGALLVGPAGAAAAAGVGLGLYYFLCFAFYMHWLPIPPDQEAVGYARTATTLAYPMILNTLGIGVVAMLAGALAERLRRTGGALAAAETRAARVERLAELGRIAAWLAHEIRNPLGSISGSIELLRESASLSEEERHLCAIVTREAKRLNALVGDMLDLSKPKSPMPRDVELALVAQEVVALSRSAHRAAEGGVSVRYEGETKGAHVHCDPDQMRQVLWNLLRNALDVSPPESSVTVRVLKLDGRVRLDVEDAGPGLSAEAKPRIFDAFYSNRAHGAGIGLAVVKRIVDDHAAQGASIEVENLSPRGAAFRVWLRSLDSPAP